MVPLEPILYIYYPYFNIPVDLNIDPIETNVLELPSDIATLAFNDTIVITRFKTLLDSVFTHIPNLQLSSLVIGCEVDAYLGTDSARWTQYTSFYSTVSAYAKTLRPGLNVSCEAMYSGIIGAASKYLKALNVFSDCIGVSYYPLNMDFTVKPSSIVATDFLNVVNQYPSKPIYYYQLGYPSSASCKSSELLQAQFIQQVFQSWDKYSANIKMIDFTWLHDWSHASVDIWSKYYGISDTSFLAYLGSIGLQTWNGKGKDKLAFKELQCQAKQRGFNSLPINCTNNISINNFNPDTDNVKLFPDPVQNILNIEASFDLKNTGIIIYNQLGQIKKIIRKLNGRKLKIETANLPNGIYFIDICFDNNHIKKKFIKFDRT